MWQAFLELITVTPDLLARFVIGVLLSIGIGLGIALVYKLTHRGLSYEATFLSSLVAIAPVVACVMFFIQGNLVLSLGLVGSLSIIRFRTPIKDSRDMVFLFWSITAGLGAGTNNLGIVLIASVLIAIMFVIMHLANYGIPKKAEYVLIIRGEGDYPADAVDRLIAGFGIEAYLRSHEVKEGRWERIIELKLAKANPELIDQLAGAVGELDQLTSVSILAPQLVLPM
ncbi:MAG: DUF4956 domain-containing protein [Firmicutes bacterium]|jgi:hypothetical protein|nr:DUF4956 domain-containing protein [Bacillota bacterium]NLL87918.1 DUF4956 domain-containing protein [Bacillota bacterium]HKM16772.1 DUF4956 domain-containing protein [Limnochordia bacterium]